MQKEFGLEIADKIYKHETEGTINDPEYQKLSTQWQQTHVCTVVPWPDTLVASFASVGKDPTVSTVMWVSIYNSYLLFVVLTLNKVWP